METPLPDPSPTPVATADDLSLQDVLDTLDPMLVAQVLVAREGLRRERAQTSGNHTALPEHIEERDRRRLAGRILRDCRG